MKRLPILLAALLTLVLLPASAEAQTDLGVRAKLLFPSGDFDEAVRSGWGLAGTADLTVVPLVKIRGEVGYNRFDAEDPSGDVSYEDRDIWNFGIGARLELSMIYFSLDGSYYTEIDEFSVLPGLGLRFLFFDVGARYKWTGENWFELFGGIVF